MFKKTKKDYVVVGFLREDSGETLYSAVHVTTYGEPSKEEIVQEGVRTLLNKDGHLSRQVREKAEDMTFRLYPLEESGYRVSVGLTVEAVDGEDQ